MSKTSLYLIQTRARWGYQCFGCGKPIPSRTVYFRHDPHPYARMSRGEQRTHWCVKCIASAPGVRDQVGRIWVKRSDVAHIESPGAVQLEQARVEIVRIGELLSARLAKDPSLLHAISPAQFEDFLCDRLHAMGFEPKQTGSTFTRDGGIDILFWPRVAGAFPSLGAVQAKHHRDPGTKEGSSTVRDFAGALAGHAFNAAMLVTNTSFTADAEWFARERAKLIRLRDFEDIGRWLQGSFSEQAEWREIPREIVLGPGLVIPVGCDGIGRREHS
jgi:hypothetical protein